MSRAAKVAIGVFSVAVLAIVILVVVLVEHVGESKLTASKRVTPDAIKRFDTIVVLPRRASAFTLAAVEDRMNRLDAVQQYAEVPRSTLASLVSRGNGADADALSERICATPSMRGYAVALAPPTDDSRRRLAGTLGDDATVTASQYQPPQTEIFMKVRATAAQAQAVQARLDRDPDVTTFRYLDHEAAYEEFKRLFADQPVLVQGEKPDGSGLPESFRLDLRDGASPAAIAARFRDLPGVDQVIVPPRSVLPSAGFFDVCAGR